MQSVGFTTIRLNIPQSPRHPFSSHLQPFQLPVVSSDMIAPGPILLFDGFCNLCNNLVRFVIKQDRKKVIRFASLQSPPGNQLLRKFGLDSDDFDSVVYVSGERYYLKSSAVLHIFKDIGHGWRLVYGFIIIPKFIRDFLYDIISKSRHRIFGKTDACMVPSEEIKERFL